MTPAFSIYLDLVRFVAAVLVVIYHANMRNIIEDVVPLSHHGHAAVIIFFVLSGYVIAYVTDRKENTPAEYWASRLSRIYSLALPAVFLTPLLDVAGEAMQPAFYEGKTTHDYWYVRMTSSLLFLNEIWAVSIMSFSNVPYWSLCYEMWYYILFAILTFTNGKRRALLLFLVCSFLGPKILLLGPIWALGVFIYRYQPLYRISEITGWGLFLASVVLFCFFESASVTERLSEGLHRVVGSEWHTQLTCSKFFLGDYPLALIIMLNFVGFRRIASRFGLFFRWTGNAIRTVSSYTFSIYIFHQPLLFFFAAAIDGDPKAPLFYLEVMAATALAICLISNVTEQRRGVLRRHLRNILVRLERNTIPEARIHSAIRG